MTGIQCADWTGMWCFFKLAMWLWNQQDFRKITKTRAFNAVVTVWCCNMDKKRATNQVAWECFMLSRTPHSGSKANRPCPNDTGIQGNWHNSTESAPSQAQPTVAWTARVLNYDESRYLSCDASSNGQWPWPQSQKEFKTDKGLWQNIPCLIYLLLCPAAQSLQHDCECGSICLSTTSTTTSNTSFVAKTITTYLPHVDLLWSWC